MNFNSFKTFITVCEKGNFTEAAKNLFVPQPTVSNRIRVLEEELGQDLFVKKNKGKRSVELTEAGRTFLPYAKEMLDSLQTIKSKMTFNHSLEHNQLKIATTIPLNHPYVFKKIKSIFSSSSHLKVLNIDDCHLLDEFTQNNIDIAIVTSPMEDKQFKCFALGSEQLQVIASQHSLLSKENFIKLQGKSVLYLKPFFDQVRLILGGQFTDTRLLETNDLGTIKRLILDNEGIAIMPPGFFSQEIEDNSMVSVTAEEMDMQKVTYYLVSRKNTEYSQILEV